MNENTLLVAVDGEEKSMKTIQYISSFRPYRDKVVVLLNVMNRVPEYYYDLCSEAFSRDSVVRSLAWESGARKRMEFFMKKARVKLIACGFPPERVRIEIRDRNRGVARDILDEARKGYHGLVLRRRGMAKAVLPVPLGSVSTKLIEEAVDVPLILAGVRELTHTLFLAVDGSAGSERAVAFAARTLQGSGCRFVLGSVIRDFCGPCDGSREWEANGAAIVEKAQAYASKVLLDAGFRDNRITRRVIKGGKSRAGAIVETALADDCDTIVLGRKGMSTVSDFNIGRVPWKVVHGARKMTVWMIP
ncbi:MAG: universal stress protein [Desulfobacter sp.]|nr:MAG: universal stress protein [Desulfobacter sp.]